MTAGMSEDAKAVEKAVSGRLQETDLYSVSFAGQHDDLLAELRDLWAECRDDGWDGYGARGLQQAAWERAAKLIQALPPFVPQPELSAMPEGDVAFDWDFAPRKTLTVQVSSRIRLAWAAIDGDEEVSGTVSFVSTFPSSIQRVLEQISS